MPTTGGIGWFDPMYLLFLAPGLLLALWAQWRVKSAYARASQMRAESGLTGAETAQMILQAHGISNVGIEPSRGFMSDHYDPRAKMLRLSPDVFQGRSVAALGIAAHEAGHAVQDAVHYAPLKLRNGIVPLAAIGSNLSFLLIFAGIALNAGTRAAGGSSFGQFLLLAGIGAFSLTVLFQLINLPVEFDASRRAKGLLRSAGLISAGPEAAAMNRVLNAAAMTYVAATVTAIQQLLYYLLRSGVLGGRRE